MQHQFFEARYYETYYFAYVVSNILHNQFSYLRNLDTFYGDGKFLTFVKPFPKHSAFHSFVEFVIGGLLDEEIDQVDLPRRQEMIHLFSSLPDALADLEATDLPINQALNYYAIEHTPFVEWLTYRGKTFNEAVLDDVADYYSDLRLEGPYDFLLEKAVREVFFVVFQNRRILLLFNQMLARQIADSCIGEDDKEYGLFFAAPGVLKRTAIPSWVRRAVFFRDRGFCVICHRDLSGVLNISTMEHFDHIVPLARGGLNDVSNIQLLCQSCNLKKQHHEGTTSDYYEAWYPMSESDE